MKTTIIQKGTKIKTVKGTGNVTRVDFDGFYVDMGNEDEVREEYIDIDDEYEIL